MKRSLSSSSRESGLDTPRRLIAVLLASALIAGPLQTFAQESSADQQLKELQNQMSLLRERIALIKTQSELDTAKAQAEFAKLAGIKAGLSSVGAPPGKDGDVAVTAGTDGALLLKLKAPMITGLETAATRIANAVVSEKGRLGGGVALASDTDVQAALQAAATHRAMQETAKALQEATEAIRGTGLGTASVGAAVAGASLVLQTINDFSKLFRTDRAMSVHDAGTEAGYILQLLLENRLAAENGLLVNLGEIVPQDVLAMADKVQEELVQLKNLHAQATIMLRAIDAMTANERPNEDHVDKLRAATANAKELYDAVHPEQKSEAFWSYVGGRYKDKRLRDKNAPDSYLGRLTFNAKAQTVQVIESRTFRSDKIYGTGGVQVDYRIVDGKGALLKSELWLLTIDSDSGSNSARAWPASAARAGQETAALAVNE